MSMRLSLLTCESFNYKGPIGPRERHFHTVLQFQNGIVCPANSFNLFDRDDDAAVASNKMVGIQMLR